MKRILWDFDDSIAPLEKDGVPKASYPGTAKIFFNLRKQGFEILVWSARWNSGDEKKNKEEINIVRKFMYKFKIPYDGILPDKKPHTTFFVDDRAINFSGNPKQTYDILINKLNKKEEVK